MSRTNPEVEAWFAGCDNPLKDVMLRVRQVALAADPRLGEAVKWQAPTFIYKGAIASFNPRSTRHVSLVFHSGAEIPGRYALLEGDGKKARTARFADAADVDRVGDELARALVAWCDLKDQA